MIPALILFMAMGQQPGDVRGNPAPPLNTSAQMPLIVDTPLKCGKYQHIDDTCYANMTTGGCLPAKCADDMHSVTEREWVERDERLTRDEKWIRALIDRLDVLEHELQTMPVGK